MLRPAILTLLTLSALTSCGPYLPLYEVGKEIFGTQTTYRMENGTSFVSTKGTHKVTVTDKGIRNDYVSSSAGNLMATAIREVYDLDVALYPRDLINEENVGFVSANMTEQDMSSLMRMYPLSGNKDEFIIGVMRGRDIKKLVRTRIQDTFKLDIEVAGMVYNIHMVAGVVTMDNYGLDNGREFNDRESYRVAISQHFFFSGETFPSYRFRNGLNFSFVPNGQIISAKETLRTYLRTVGELPYLNEVRGRFSDFSLDNKGLKKTYEIQGGSHRSPLWGHKVQTRGIVTAIDGVDWFPRGIDIIIQDPQGDGRDDTSDALHVHLEGDMSDVRVGDDIQVAGTVFEHMTLDRGQNMSKTVLRDITDIKILSSGNALPKATVIGLDGRKIPTRVLSTWVGDLNFKPFLTLTDGIDFWESLEGMRVTVKNPRITGFRGGQEELMRLRAQRHLSLFIVPDGFRNKSTRTLTGGQMEDFMVGDFNPEVIHLSAGHLTADFNRLKPSNPRRLSDCEDRGGILYKDDEGKERCRIPSGLTNTDYHYNVGDLFKGDITGIISFESNLFGGGEYTLVLPKPIFRYDKDVNNGPDAPCLVRSLEYLNPDYTELFDQGIENASCNQIMATREAVANKNAPEKYKAVQSNFLRKSFTNDSEINCLDVDFFRKPMPFECRPITSFKGEKRKLTIAAYNLENLAGNQADRLRDMGNAIKNNLRCPDIISLVEIQDNNGLDLQGDANADRTIAKLIKASNCASEGVIYKGINIDPVNHNEGGQPGGNIRVAMIYNSARVNFEQWGQPTDGPLRDGSLQETRVTDQGNLSINPGRVFPNSDAFKNTRKSIVAQFDFLGEKIFVIGNHFNSKLGDTSFWGAIQPPYPESDEERAELAMGINEFVRIIEMREPNAHIVVLGDFNAHYNERSMRTLENEGDLINMMFHPGLVHPNDRYSHNYNGSSSAIDFIFANKNFMAKEPGFETLHINSDYMGRLSDHDPVIAKFHFRDDAAVAEERRNSPLGTVLEERPLQVKVNNRTLLQGMLQAPTNFVIAGKLHSPTLYASDILTQLKANDHCALEGYLGGDSSLKVVPGDSANTYKLKGDASDLTLSCFKKGPADFSWSDIETILGGALVANGIN